MSNFWRESSFFSSSKKTKSKTQKIKKPDVSDELEYMLRVFGQKLPSAVREYRFHPTRRWRFDFAWPDHKVAVECDGGQWAFKGGRHNTDADRDKINTATSLGWSVLRFSRHQITHEIDTVLDRLRESLKIVVDNT
jgi:very-short-patch-repair endonuclease